MKALLISTLISTASVTDRPADIDQMYIWFEGPSSHTECVRAEQEMAIGAITLGEGDKVSSQATGPGNNAKVTRRTRCVKFN